MNTRTHDNSQTHSRAVRPNVNRPRLRYRGLALGIGLALGSLVSAGAIAKVPGIPPVSAIETPTGGKVVGGKGSIIQNGAQTIINQQTQFLSLNWQTFNVGKDASVLFKQPSFTAVALNRILDQNPSQIFGKVSSNGQIFLINTHGIIFGASAQLNVGGLVASTLDLTDKDFLNKHFVLDARGGHAGVVNYGTIAAASGGSVTLIGGHVVNDGLILANYGRINLNGADQAVLDFDGEGLVHVQITGKLKKRLDSEKAAVINKGTLQADAGTVVLEAAATRELFTNLVNNSGVIQARGISRVGGEVRLLGPTQSQGQVHLRSGVRATGGGGSRGLRSGTVASPTGGQGGTVRLIAHGGNTLSSGDIDVSGTHGGTVQLLSDRNVGVMSGTINASGSAAGGSIRIGGGYQGGEGLQHAARTYVGADAVLNVDATNQGDGGTLVLWSDDNTVSAGTLSARGGAYGGDGGLVETSSHGDLTVTRAADASAAHGQAGNWLLDPNNIEIVASGADTHITASTPFQSTDDGSKLTVGTLKTALTGGTNVTVQTMAAGTNLEDGDITFTANLDYNGIGTGGTLTLDADRNIVIDGSITDGTTTTIDSLGLVLDAGGVVTFNNAVNVASLVVTSGGDITQSAAGVLTVAGTSSFTAGAHAITLDNTGNHFTGAVSLTGTTTSITNAGALTLGTLNTGNLTVTSHGALNLGSGTVDGTLDATSNNGAITQAGALSVTGTGSSAFNAGTGNITLDTATNSFAGPIDISAAGAVELAGSLIHLGTVDNITSLLLDNAATLHGDITTSGGAVSMSGAITLDAATVSIDTTDGGGSAVGANIHFASTVDGTTAGVTGLTLQAGTGGTVGFSNTVGSGVSLASLHATAKDIVFTGGAITTTQTQTYDGVVAVNNPTTLTGVGITFNKAVDSSGGTPINLTIHGGSGTVDFNAATGDNFALGALSIDGSGAISMAAVKAASLSTGTGTTTLGGNITTTGAQTYNGAVLLGTGITLTTTDNNVHFKGAVDNAVSGTPEALTVNAGTGAVDFDHAVGGSNGALGALTLSDSGATSLAAVTASSLDTGTGTITLQGDVTTSGSQTYDGAVLLDDSAGDDRLNLSGDNISFNSALDNAASLGSVQALTVDVSDTTGVASFGATVGGGANGELGALTLNAGNYAIFSDTLQATSVEANLAVRLHDDVTTHGAQTWGGTLYLFNPVSLASNGGAISLADVSNQSILPAATLVVDAGTGTVAFNGDVCTSGCGFLLGLTVTATGGISQGVGSEIHALASSFDAGTSAITLANAANDFAGTVSLTGGATQITDATALTLGALNTGNLIVTSHGALNLGSGTVGGTLDATSNNNAIIQAGVLTVTGIATLDAGTGNITLTTAGNDFQNAVSLTGATTQLVDTNALTLGTVATGALTVSSGGALNLGSGTVTGNLSASSAAGGIGQSGALTVTGTSTLAATGAAVALTNTGNDFQGGVSASGDGISLTDTNNLTLTSLTDTNNGDVSLIAGGLLTLAGAINAGTGNITLAANGGSLSTAALTGTNINLTGRDGITLGDNVTAVGTLALTSTNTAITQTGGAISATGATTVNAGTGAITLAMAGNDFQSTVDLVGGTTQLVDTNALTLSNVATGNLTATSGNALNLGSGTVTGNLSATSASGGINQAGALTVTGTSALTATGGAVALTNTGNDFQGGVSASGDGVALTDTNNLTLTSLTDTNNGDVGLIAGGLLTLAGAINAGTGNITLAANGGSLSTAALTGTNINLTGRDGITLGDNVTAVGTLALTSTNTAITQTGGAISATGTTTVNAGGGAITLIGVGNHFTGAVSLNNSGAHNVALNNGTHALVLGASSVGTGTLSLSGTGITQTGAITQAAGAGAATFNAGAGVITLTTAGNDFTGAVSLNNSGAHNVALDNGTHALVLGASNVGTGTLTLDANGITQTGAITQAASAGAATFNAGSGTLDLSTTSNSFTGAVSLSGGTTSITNASALTLGTLATGNLTVTSNGALNLGSGTVGGTLDATSNNNAIIQTGVLTVTGIATLDAGTGNITLTTAGNDFQNAVSLTGATTQLADTNALTLGTVATGGLTVSSGGALNLGSGTVTGNLSASSAAGGISQTNALTVTGTSTLAATGGAVALTNTGNDFQGGVSASGDGISLADTNNLTITLLTDTNNGDVSLIAGGLLTLAGAINAGTGNITLAANGGSLSTAALTGTDIDLTGRDGISLGDNVAAAGTLALTSTNAAITQTGGAISATGATTINAGTGVITLAMAGNDFQSTVDLVGGTTQLVDTNALTLSNVATGNLTATSGNALNLGSGTVTGNLSATSAAGGIGQSGVLTVTGTSALTATGAAIALTNTGNDFQGGVSASGDGISLADTNNLTITLLTDTNNGDVSLIAGGLLSLAGAINAGTGNITLAANGGSLSTDALTGTDINLTGRDGITLGDNVAAAGTLALTSTNTAITQTGGSITATGATTVNAGTGAITLAMAGNDFQNTVDLAGGTTQLVDTNALTLGNVATGNLTATSGNALNLGSGSITGNLSATSAAGGIGQSGALTITGTSTLVATGAAIALANTGNDFQGGVSASGGGVSITDANNLTLTSLTDTNNGNVSLIAGGLLTLAGAINAGTGNITLAANGGSLSTDALTGTDIDLTGRDGISLGDNVAAAGTLALTSTNTAITQTGGSITATGATTINAGSGAITLAMAGNDFQNTVDLAGGTTQLVDTNALTLGNVATGNLTVTSGDALNLGSGTVTGNLSAASASGGISQSGGLTVTGNSAISATGAAITLADTDNDFQGTVDLIGGTTQLADANALTLGNVATGDLTVTSGNALNLGNGSITGNLSATSGAGGIGQSGVLTVVGTSTLAATGGAVALTNTGNDFQSGVSASGDGVSLADANNLTITSLVDTNNGNVSLIAGGLLGLAQAINAGTGNVTLAANGGSLSTMALTGTNIDLTGRDGISLGDNVVAAGTLALTSTNAAITQAGGTTTVTGTTTINAGTGTITLAMAGNDFQSTVNLIGGATQLFDANTLSLGNVATGDMTVTSGDALNLGSGTITGNLSATSASGGISQSGGLTVTGNSAINATGAAITLADAGNDFQGTVDLNGGTTQLIDVNALTLGNVATSDLTVTSGNALNLGTGTVTGNLSATSSAGGIGQSGALTVIGTSTLAATGGAVALANTGNDFQSGVSVSGDGVALTDANDLTLVSLTDTNNGSVSLIAGGLLTLAGAINAGTGNITLATNGGSLSAAALTGTDISLTGRDGISLGGNVAAAGTLALTSTNAAITQTGGAIAATGVTTVNAGTGAITLAMAGNDFQSAVNLTGGTTQLTDANTLTLGNVATDDLTATSGDALNLGSGTVTGNLSVTSAGGGISQTGTLTVTGTSTINATAGAITLADANNDFQSTVNLNGGTTQLTDANALTLGNVATGGLTVTSTGDLNLGQGSIHGALAANSNQGKISQAGALVVAGTAVINAGTGAVMLMDAGNDFQTSVSASGNGIYLRDLNDLVIAGISDGNDATVDVQAGGDLQVAGKITAGNGNVGLAAGGLLSIDADIDPGTVILLGKGIALNADVTASQGLSMISGAGITQDAVNSVITASSLTGQSAGATHLGGANAIASLGDFHAAGFTLVNAQSLTVAAGSTVDGQTGVSLKTTGSGHDITLNGNVTGQQLELISAGAIGQGGGSVITADTLTGSSVGDTTLAGANLIAALDAFHARNLALTTAGALQVTGPVAADAAVALASGSDLTVAGSVNGTSVDLSANGNLAINAMVDSGSGTTTLTQNGTGAITEGAGGNIVASVLTGSADGSTTLGSATQYVDNHVGTLGGFTSKAGFSLTNGETLTLGSVNGSSYTVDAGTSDMYLEVRGGDLLQNGSNFAYNGRGTWSATGHIGLQSAPIYVTALNAQTVGTIGRPPAYFYAIKPDGSLLPIVGSNSVNVPVAQISSQSLGATNPFKRYIDISAVKANYRGYGVVQPGVLVPPDQWQCPAQSMSDWCPEGY